MRQHVPRSSLTDIETLASNWILRRDAGLTAEEEAEFQRWKAEDPRHADAVARKDTAWAALDRPRHSGQAGWLLQRLEARAAKRRHRRVAIAAAGVAILITVGAFLRVQPVSPAVFPDAQGIVVLPEMQTLPDGSVVELRPGAEVGIDFHGQLRGVHLKKGEAYFRVAKDQDRPFVVAAGNVEFRAIGTAFSVELGREEVDVLVTEGRVAVEKSEPAAPTPEPARTDVASAARPQTSRPVSAADAGRVQTIATIDAGSRLVVGLRQAAAPVPTAVSEDAMARRLAWRAPKLEFSELPLGEAVALLNRYNKVQFMIEDATLARLRVSGFFRADNTDTFVRLLEGTCGIKAERSDATIVLRKAVP